MAAFPGESSGSAGNSKELLLDLRVCTAATRSINYAIRFQGSVNTVNPAAGHAGGRVVVQGGVHGLPDGLFIGRAIQVVHAAPRRVISISAVRFLPGLMRGQLCLGQYAPDF